MSCHIPLLTPVRYSQTFILPMHDGQPGTRWCRQAHCQETDQVIPHWRQIKWCLLDNNSTGYAGLQSNYRDDLICYSQTVLFSPSSSLFINTVYFSNTKLSTVVRGRLITLTVAKQKIWNCWRLQELNSHLINWAQPTLATNTLSAMLNGNTSL